MPLLQQDRTEASVSVCSAVKQACDTVCAARCRSGLSGMYSFHWASLVRMSEGNVSPWYRSASSPNIVSRK